MYPPWVEGLRAGNFSSAPVGVLCGRIRALSQKEAWQRAAAPAAVQARALADRRQQMDRVLRHTGDLFERAPVPYFILDRHGSICRSNAAAVALLGKPARRLHGHLLSFAFIPSEGLTFSSHLRLCAADRTQEPIEVTLADRGAGPIPVQAQVLPIHADAGRVLGFRVTLTELTSRRPRERQLQVLNEASAILSSTTADQDCLRAVLALLVPQMARHAFLDLKGEEGELMRLHAAVGSTAAGCEQRAWAEEAFPLHGQISPQAVVLRRGEPMLSGDRGESRRGTLVLAPLTSPDGCLGVLTTVLAPGGLADSPESMLRFMVSLGQRLGAAYHRGRLHQRLGRALRSRETFMGMVSHDLRNMLNSVSLTSQLMATTAARAGAERLHTQAQGIGSIVRRMGRLMEDLLDVTSIERGHLSLHFGEHAAAALAREAHETAERAAAQRDLVLEMRASTDGPIRCDRERTLQVLANLLDNAIKHAPTGSRILLSTRAQGQQVIFGVADAGAGIQPEQLPHIFDSYWYGSEAPVGTKNYGLGLAIARGIVEGSGGKIWAESTVGRGSAFYFSLPQGSTAPAQSQSGGASTRGTCQVSACQCP